MFNPSDAHKLAEPIKNEQAVEKESQLEKEVILAHEQEAVILLPAEKIAKEVLAGKWRNGSERKSKLESAGYVFEYIQISVDKLSPKPVAATTLAPSTPTVNAKTALIPARYSTYSI